MTDWGQLAHKGVDNAREFTGHVVDKASEKLGKALDTAGAHGLADKVEDFGDGLASKLGVSVHEQELGQTEQPNELVHGSPSAIRETVKHFQDFQGAFDRVGQGMPGPQPDHVHPQPPHLVRRPWPCTGWVPGARSL
ncbi:hypothetical protein OHB36_01975 [Streptomyces sp. NBC_00320]|uniref:putative T7SS-secreted protein n=1 Tax=Streptomyces sp. NBC_00320 TaxID=2975711 RepID=UPI00224F17F9|nr:hypothetical protein [Streptomyces sp. NBC_00320]MCX5145555.1 hypothetical protein [Streptomyces sp. NBC_00320]